VYHDLDDDDLDIKVIGHIDLDYFIPCRALRKCSKQRIYLEQREYYRLVLNVNVMKGLGTGVVQVGFGGEVRQNKFRAAA